MSCDRTNTTAQSTLKLVATHLIISGKLQGSDPLHSPDSKIFVRQYAITSCIKRQISSNDTLHVFCRGGRDPVSSG